jgi:hypothetical protein
MTKDEALSKLKGIDVELRDYVKKKIHEIEDIADEHGIIVRFNGLPPYDEYGNSGYYFPVQSDGTPWYSSDMRNEYWPLEGHGALEGWLSSDAGC